MTQVPQLINMTTVVVYFNRSFTSDLVDTLKRHTRCQLSYLLAMERDEPFTLNDHYFTDSKAKYLEQMKAKVFKAKNNASAQNNPNRVRHYVHYVRLLLVHLRTYSHVSMNSKHSGACRTFVKRIYRKLYGLSFGGITYVRPPSAPTIHVVY